MREKSRRSSVVSAIMTKVSRKAAMKKSSILKLSLNALVNIRLPTQAMRKSRKGRPSALGYTFSLEPAADMRNHSPKSPTAASTA